ncbi:DSC2 protein, partial [Atractosteus spatula]|nr:DSC2 protein [Atractosteus spatula]
VVAVSADHCLPATLHATVPEEIKTGYIVSKVDLGRCVNKELRLTTSDLDFAVQVDGTISALQNTRIPSEGRAFLIRVEGQEPGQKGNVYVTLSAEPQEVPSNKTLRRTKRRWSPLPFSIKENDVPPFPKNIEMIGSDSAQEHKVYYRIFGPGVDQAPVGLFSVEPNGLLKVHRSVDREEKAEYVFTARVFSVSTHQETDQPLPVTVKVEDVNDNAPVFASPLTYSVLEHCSSGTSVGRANATDRDEPNTPHTKLRYKLLSGGDLFAIDPSGGLLSTRSNSLDREVKDKYEIILEVRDMDGQPNGLFSTATATVVLDDINDNPPTFQQSSYNVKIEENKNDVLLLRIPVDDKDLKKTPNWNAKYFITEGNENRNFRIETDPETNEALLYVSKALDYEKTPNLKLEVSAQNEAKLVGTTAPWASIPVDVNVVNVDEGPEFSSPNMFIRVKENLTNGTLIGRYTATDPETKTSSGIKYYEVSDPASWIDVGETTGELKVANVIDRESSFVKDNKYNITVRAVDQSSKSATGTVILYIDDVNDNFPEVTSKDLIICEQPGKPGSVKVVAQDNDEDPFSAPFTFTLAQGQDEKWRLKDHEATSVVLEAVHELPRGTYTVPLIISDLQNIGKEQSVTVRICKCLDGQCLAQQSSAAFGTWGILAMLLSLALLLLLCVFLVFACGTKREKVYIDASDATDGMLLKSNTEAPGEEVMSSNIMRPAVSGAGLDQKGPEVFINGSGMGGTLNSNNFSTMQSTYQTSGNMFLNGAYPSGAGNYNASHLMLEEQYGGAVHGELAEYTNTWRTNGLFISKKLNSFLTEQDDRYADDIIHSYQFEGRGSVAGSVGCCSDQAVDEGYDFLNTLGPKFRTLAEVCAKK